MIRINVLVEGYTESFFVRDNLSQALSPFGIYLTPILFKTSKYGRGGITTYKKIQNQVNLLCKKDTSAYVTTLLDYYGLPSDFPGVASNTQSTSSLLTIAQLENAFAIDINKPEQFIPNLMVHEFEALLFSDVAKFKDTVTDDEKSIQQLIDIRNQFPTPEDINNNYETAPSKRLEKIFPDFNKVIDGNFVAETIGLDKIRQECHHFDSWIRKLCELAPL